MSQDEDEKSASFAVIKFRLGEVEKRMTKVETFILGFFVVVALGFLYGVMTLLKLPVPT